MRDCVWFKQFVTAVTSRTEFASGFPQTAPGAALRRALGTAAERLDKVYSIYWEFAQTHSTWNPSEIFTGAAGSADRFTAGLRCGRGRGCSANMKGRSPLCVSWRGRKCSAKGRSPLCISCLSSRSAEKIRADFEVVEYNRIRTPSYAVNFIGFFIR